MDSNHRRRRRQIYSLLPLATRESLHIETMIELEAPLLIIKRIASVLVSQAFFLPSQRYLL